MFSADVNMCAGELCAGEVTVRLEGELDIATLPCLEGVVKGLVDADATTLVLDCSALTFIDWTALRRMASVTKDAAAAGVELTVHHLPPFAVELLERTGLTGVSLGSV